MILMKVSYGPGRHIKKDDSGHPTPDNHHFLPLSRRLPGVGQHH